jgi:methyl-accepting chemotaxis protein
VGHRQAKQGAAINQTRESFDRLNESVFKMPSLLDQMRESVRGTISDTELMQGLLKLTAGATEDMAQRFANAAPQLLEIAKASNKLNPALGDTAFLYDSIATGIKRASPLILDNLGIVVKVGEANEKYAESLGKSVEELSAEEKQIALLNATL